MAEPQGPRPGGPAHAGPLPVEDAEARAARGLTLERVLQELVSIAYGDITRIVSWDTETLTMTPSGQLDPADRAAVAEIVASAKDNKIYRVKMLDKTPALALLLRWLDKEKAKSGATGDEQDDDGEDPREFIIRELARLRARRRGNSGDFPADADAEGSEAPPPVGILAAT